MKSPYLLFFLLLFSITVQGQGVSSKIKKMNSEQLIVRAQELMNSEKYNEALIHLKQAKKKSKKGSDEYILTIEATGICYYGLEQYDKTIMLYEKIMYSLDAEDELTFVVLSLLAQSYSKIGQDENAKFITDIANSIEWDVINSKITEYHRVHKYKEAIPYAEQALSIAKKEAKPKYPDYTNSLSVLALLYYSIGNFEKAELLYLEANNILKTVLSEEDTNYITNINHLANCYTSLGRYEEAELLLIQIIDIQKKVLGEEHINYIGSLSNLAILYYSIGRYIEAEHLFIKGKKIHKAVIGEEQPTYATILHNLAILYFDIGRYKEAELLLNQASDIRKKTLGGKDPSYASNLIYIAVLHQIRGHYEKAESLYIEIISIQTEVLGADHYHCTITLSALATLYHLMGRHEEAEFFFIKSRDVIKNTLGESSSDYSTILNNLGNLYSDMGRYEEAESLYIKTINIQEEVNENHLHYIRNLNNLSALYFDMGRYEEAELFLIKAKDKSEKVLDKEHLLYVMIINNLAMSYNLLERYKEAEPLFIEAKKLRENTLGKAHPEYTESLYNLSALYFDMGRYEEAIPLKIEALMANSTFLEKQYQSLGEKQQEQLLRITYNNFYDFYSLVVDMKSNDSLSLYVQNTLLIIKSLSLQNRQTLRTIVQESGDNNINELYNEWEEKKRELGQVSMLSIKDRRNRKIHLGNWLMRVNELERKLAARSKILAANFKVQNIKVKFEDIKEQLTEKSIAIDFVHFQYINSFKKTDTILYYALVTRKDSKYPTYIRIGTEREIQTLLGKKIDLKSNNYINDIRSSNKLYNLLWKPLEPYLKDIETIHLSPEGLLSQVAFETLVSNRETEKRLLDKYKFQYYGTLKDFVLEQKGVGQIKPVQNKEVVLLGGALYDLEKSELEQLAKAYQSEQNRTSGIGSLLDSNKVSSFNYLKGTKKEVEQLNLTFKQAGWKVNALVGKEALEEKIKALGQGDKPQVLHFATHGFFFPKPQNYEKQEKVWLDPSNTFQQRVKQHWHPLYRSGLVLSGANHTWMGGTPPENAEDGILTAYEVAMLDLYGTELVVLSACETGRGEASNTEGIYGLQRAFKQAGVHKLIVSLWQVPDQQTQELMGYFYKNYLSGKSINESLETAKATMRKAYPNPYYWAAFILVE